MGWITTAASTGTPSFRVARFFVTFIAIDDDEKQQYFSIHRFVGGRAGGLVGRRRTGSPEARGGSRAPRRSCRSGHLMERVAPAAAAAVTAPRRQRSLRRQERRSTSLLARKTPHAW